MDVAELSEMLYARHLNEDELAQLEAMDESDRMLFWTRLYHEMPYRLNRTYFREMEETVLRGITRKRIAVGLIQSANDDMESIWEPVRPHAWFRRSIGR